MDNILHLLQPIDNILQPVHKFGLKLFFNYIWKWNSLSCGILFSTPWVYSPWNSLGQNTEVGSFSLLQGIFPAQRSNPGLLHCRQILYQLSHKGSPRILEWVAYPFSSGSSRPRNRTGISCIAGRFFTDWAIREAHIYIYIHTHTHTHILSVFTFFSLIGYYKILSLVPCVI